MNKNSRDPETVPLYFVSCKFRQITGSSWFIATISLLLLSLLIQCFCICVDQSTGDVHFPTPLWLGFLVSVIVIICGIIFFTVLLHWYRFSERVVAAIELWRVRRICHPAMTETSTAVRSFALLSTKVDLMFVRRVCVCVPNLLYMCEYINFYGGPTTTHRLKGLFKPCDPSYYPPRFGATAAATNPRRRKAETLRASAFICSLRHTHTRAPLSSHYRLRQLLSSCNEIVMNDTPERKKTKQKN